MSSVVELMLLVSLGLRPSLHAAARKVSIGRAHTVNP
jgi:hypothetical protein